MFKIKCEKMTLQLEEAPYLIVCAVAAPERDFSQWLTDLVNELIRDDGACRAAPGLDCLPKALHKGRCPPQEHIEGHA